MRTEGYTELVCDRAGCQLEPVYASKEKIDLMGWAAVQHVDANGASRSFDLCPDCYGAWQKKKQAQDKALMAFMNGE